MTLLGFDMDLEVSASKGSVDAVLELDDKVYIMEIKYSKCQPGKPPPDDNPVVLIIVN